MRRINVARQGRNRKTGCRLSKISDAVLRRLDKQKSSSINWWSSSIIAEDAALLKMGLVDFIPCSVEIIATEEEIDGLVEEVFQMEADAWNFDDQELKEPEIAKLQKELENKYQKYAIIVGYLGT